MIFKASVFTEEYKIDVIIGNREFLLKNVRKAWIHCDDDEFDNLRWKAFNALLLETAVYPIIAIRDDLVYKIAIPTLAHEAAHAMDYIIEFIWIDDRSGEFRAHGIASVMREFMRRSDLILKPKSKPKRKKR